MAQMEVILTQDVDSLGNAGEVVKVKAGYGRNYLLPRGYALIATRGNMAQLEHHKRRIAAEQAKLRAEYEAQAKKLGGVSVAIPRAVGEGDKLFGSVTNKDIAEALAQQDIKLDRKLIKLSDPIKEVGSHEVEVRFTNDVKVQLKVTVVAIKQ